MLPISATNAIRQFSPRKTTGTPFFTHNRFGAFRASSPADSTRSESTNRSRSVSTKRKNDDTPSYAAVTGGGMPNYAQAVDSSLLEKIQTDIAKVSNMCDKVTHDFSKSGVDGALFIPFNGICEALKLIVNVQQDVLTAITIVNAKPVSIPPASNFLKRPRQDLSQSFLLPPNSATGGAFRPATAAGSSRMTATDKGKKDSELQVDPIVKKFREAVKEAEKSTLIFNLNMGKVPIMNKNSMSTKATVALTEMAAAAEGKTSSIPSADAVASIDDVLSMVKGMTFFGKATKSYSNQKDPLSGSFCTVPVKYSFQSKDTRIMAETTLREKCKVNCSTPYPIILRETIRQTVAHIKIQFPDNQVRVNVDTAKLGLKISRRPPKCSVWKDYKHPVPLPTEVFDVSARAVPDGFKVTGLPEPDPIPPAEKDPAIETMDTTASQQSSPRLSRHDAHIAAKAATPKK